LAAPHVDLEEVGVAVAPLAVLLDPLGDRDLQVGHGDAVVGEADLGVLDQVADDGGVVVRCHLLCAPSCCWLAFGADPLRAVPGAGGLGAGGVDGVGHAVVLAGLPDDGVAVVLAAIVDGDADAEREGGLALGDVAVADAVRAVSGHPELRVEPVEGLLGDPLEGGMGVVVGPVAVVQVVGQVGVVVGPGPDLGLVGGRVGDGVRVGPVVGG
jgi:hypothetical protein